MRNIPPSMDALVVAEIDARLERVSSAERVAVAWAIESGSRAWGFPSPDSDYDCRFLYVREPGEYLTLWPKRDVIEAPLDEVFDVNGWDLTKALRLMLKGNAVVVEWLRSPIIYGGDEGFRSSLLSLAAEVTNPILIGRHYLHVGRRQWPKSTADVSLKKVFYALRPAATLRWLRRNSSNPLPPMNLAALLDECDPPRDVVSETEELVALKAITREVGRGVFPPALSRFVTEEFELAYGAYEHADLRIDKRKAELVDEYFRSAVASLS
jgi:uncharacterized protein